LVPVIALVNVIAPIAPMPLATLSRSSPMVAVLPPLSFAEQECQLMPGG